jgi:hypothetical protein
MESKQSELERIQHQEARSGLATDFLYFVLNNKKWWLVPVLVVLLLLGLLMLLSTTAAAPFIYTLF